MFSRFFAKDSATKKHAHFIAEVHVNTKEEGGHSAPIFDHYYPFFNFSNQEVRGFVHILNGFDLVMPGDTDQMEITLDAPAACEVGTRFTIREEALTVGFGTITQILD